MNRKDLNYYWGPGVIQDGKLDDTCGRIVIYEDKVMVGRMRTMDHNYLLRSLAAAFRVDKDAVISKAIRLYYKFDPNENGYIFSHVRKIDRNMFENNMEFYAELLKKNIP
jgi:hypothetical protein